MDYFWVPLGIFKPFYYIVLSLLLQWMTFGYSLVSSSLSITLYRLSFFNGRLLITPWYLHTFLLHCIACPSSMDDFWLPLSIFKPFYYIVLSVLLQWTTFDYPLVSSSLSITLYCLSFFNGRLLITPWYLQTFLLHCIVSPSSMDDFWLPLGIFTPFYYIVFSVLLQWTTFDYPLVSSNISFTHIVYVWWVINILQYRWKYKHQTLTIILIILQIFQCKRKTENPTSPAWNWHSRCTIFA